MKVLKSKYQEQREIEHQIRFYLRTGGKIESVDRGISGREVGSFALPPANFQEPKGSRTLLVEEVKAIEARKHKPVKLTTPRPKPKRVLITDDFGEPLRWSWEEK